MKNNIFTKAQSRKVSLLSAIFFLGLYLQSCKKDGEINPEFEQNTSKIYFSDTSTIYSKTVNEDSISTSKTSKALIGQFADSLFGLTKASYFTQIEMVGSNLDFGNSANLSVDSVVFVLKYDTIYGTNDQQTFEVFEVTESFDESKVYYSKDSLDYSSMPLGSKTFIPSVDSVLVDTTLRTAQLRIQLDNNLGTRFLNESGSATYSSKASFSSFFKGVYIKPTALNSTLLPKGAISYFELNSSTSGLYIYYTDNNVSPSVKKSIRFTVSSTAQRFANFKHDYTGSFAEKALDNTIMDTTFTFVQSMSGVKTWIQIPYLKNFSDSVKYIFNQAEMVIPIKDGTYSQFGLPTKLLLVAADSNGQGIFLPDYFLSLDYFDGNYNATTKEYKFNITRHIHQIINKNRKDYGLYLVPSGAANNARRVLIKKQLNNLEGIKLNLTYSTTD